MSSTRRSSLGDDEGDLQQAVTLYRLCSGGEESISEEEAMIMIGIDSELSKTSYYKK